MKNHITVFKTAAFNHSAISIKLYLAKVKVLCTNQKKKRKGLKFKTNSETGSKIFKILEGYKPKKKIIRTNGKVIENSRLDKSLKTKIWNGNKKEIRL